MDHRDTLWVKETFGTELLAMRQRSKLSYETPYAFNACSFFVHFILALYLVKEVVFESAVNLIMLRE